MKCTCHCLLSFVHGHVYWVFSKSYWSHFGTQIRLKVPPSNVELYSALYAVFSLCVPCLCAVCCMLASVLIGLSDEMLLRAVVISQCPNWQHSLSTCGPWRQFDLSGVTTMCPVGHLTLLHALFLNHIQTAGATPMTKPFIILCHVIYEVVKHLQMLQYCNIYIINILV